MMAVLWILVITIILFFFADLVGTDFLIVGLIMLILIGIIGKGSESQFD